MGSRIVLIEVRAVCETRQCRLGPSVCTCHHRIEVYHATVLELVADGEPPEAVCGRVAVPKGDKSLTFSADSSRPKEAAA